MDGHSSPGESDNSSMGCNFHSNQTDHLITGRKLKAIRSKNRWASKAYTKSEYGCFPARLELDFGNGH